MEVTVDELRLGKTTRNSLMRVNKLTYIKINVNAISTLFLSQA
jgi:hypothetical protein